jgi:hypothetical protein
MAFGGGGGLDPPGTGDVGLGGGGGLVLQHETAEELLGESVGEGGVRIFRITHGCHSCARLGSEE